MTTAFTGKVYRTPNVWRRRSLGNPRTRTPDRCGLAERRAAADHRRPARDDRALRLLDLRLNQLPAHAARAGGGRPGTRRRGIRRRRGALPEVPSPAGPPPRLGSRATTA